LTFEAPFSFPEGILGVIVHRGTTYLIGSALYIILFILLTILKGLSLLLFHASHQRASCLEKPCNYPFDLNDWTHEGLHYPNTNYCRISLRIYYFRRCVCQVRRRYHSSTYLNKCHHSKLFIGPFLLSYHEQTIHSIYHYHHLILPTDLIPWHVTI